MNCIMGKMQFLHVSVLGNVPQLDNRQYFGDILKTWRLYLRMIILAIRLTCT